MDSGSPADEAAPDAPDDGPRGRPLPQAPEPERALPDPGASPMELHGPPPSPWTCRILFLIVAGIALVRILRRLGAW